MSKPDKTISPKLLSCAEEEFLNVGFEKASTNAICKQAGVTTGALFKRYSSKGELFNAVVAQVADEFRNLLMEQKEDFNQLSAQEQETSAMSYSTFDFVEYVYEHFNVFKILLEGAKGTEYENYLEELAEIFSNSIQGLLESTNKKAQINSKDVSPEILHILSRSYLTGLFEPVLHNMKKSDAKDYTEQISYFFSKGWEDILGL